MFNRLETPGINEWTWFDVSVSEPRLTLMLSELLFNSRRVGNETTEQLRAVYEQAQEEAAQLATTITAQQNDKSEALKRYVSEIRDEFYLRVLEQSLEIPARV
jgi:hypothetical protein